MLTSRQLCTCFACASETVRPHNQDDDAGVGERRVWQDDAASAAGEGYTELSMEKLESV